MSDSNVSNSLHRPRSTISEVGSWRSNDMPPPDTQSRIRTLTSEARIAHSHIQELLMTQEAGTSAFRELVERRDGQRMQLQLLSSAISGIKSVPLEILSAIFVHLSDHEEGITLPPKRREYPWNVTSVCSQWRRVAWSMPETCSTIVIKRWGSPHSVLVDAQIIKDALAYTLSLSCGLVDLIVKDHKETPVVDIFLPYSHKILKLILYRFSRSAIASLFQLPLRSFNHLRELDMHVNDSQWIVFPKHSPQVMPALRNLRIDSFGDSCLRPLLDIPWTQLTVLDIDDYMTLNNVHVIFRRTHHLVRGTFLIRDIHEEVTEIGPPIRLAHLKYLSLKHEITFDMVRFLAPLTLPSLQQFKLMDFDINPPIWSHQPFTDLITRSDCKIGSLVFEDNQVQSVALLEDSIEPLLRVLPDVVRLQLPALVPSSTLMMIQENGLLQELRHVVWELDAAGLEEFIDWLLSFEVGGDHVLEAAEAFCHTGRRFVDAETRLNERKADIARAGIVAEISRFGKEHGFCDCEDSFSDGSGGSGDDDGDDSS